MKYPVAKRLGAAIEKLFDTPSKALHLLGALDGMSARDGFQESFSPNMNPTERAQTLRKTLEGHIAEMAAESEELEASEVIRLRAEAVGTLIALRELWRHFPEAFEDSSPGPSRNRRPSGDTR
jgi:hypothetical protein